MSEHDKTAPARPVILVVEEDGGKRSPLWREMAASYEVVFPESEADVSAQLAALDVALLIVDDLGGEPSRAFGLRERLLAEGRAVPMVIMTAHGDEDGAVEALKRG